MNYQWNYYNADLVLRVYPQGTYCIQVHTEDNHITSEWNFSNSLFPLYLDSRSLKVDGIEYMEQDS